MDPNRVPQPLRQQLGPAAAAGLVELLEIAKKEWTADVIELAGSRFENRLTTETASLRVHMATGLAGVRQELAEGLAAIRQEIAAIAADLRVEMAANAAGLRREMAANAADLRREMADLRQEMTRGFASIRQDMAEQRWELLRWAFLFWVGQFFAVATLMAVLVRLLRDGG